MPGGTLADYLRARREQIDEALERFLPGPPQCPSHVAEAMRYSITAGGKRLRPILTLAAAESVGTAIGRLSADELRALALPAACAIEFIHTYSLIHDDLPAMDDDALRRGRPTLHVVHGEGMAILAGDGLLTEAFALMAREPRSAELAPRKLRAIETVSQAAGAEGMVGGQALDLQAVGTAHTIGRDALQAIHARKTGAMIRAAAVVGAILADGDEYTIAAIGLFGRHVGLAFQIVDDILDVEGHVEQIGKTAGKDAQAGKPTYPSLYGIEASRRLASEQVEGALVALKSARLGEGRLADIASWIISRTN